MHPIPRFFIMLVIAIAGLGFMYRTSSVYPRKASTRTSSTLPVVSPTQAIDPLNPLSSFMGTNDADSVKIDLVGPWICEYKAEGVQVSVKVFQKNASVKLIQEKVDTRIVFKDGMLYRWEQGSSKGVTVPGLGQYVGMIEMFSAFLTPDMIVSALPGVVQSGSISKEQMVALKESCIKKEVSMDAFKIPSNVKFEETNAPQMQEEMSK